MPVANLSHHPETPNPSPADCTIGRKSSGKEVRIIAEVEAVIGNMDGVNTIRHINRTE